MRIGTDFIEIDRVRRCIERYGEALLARVFTPYEWQFCWKKQVPWPSFAARFAAKEAVAKALGVGFGASLRWVSVEVRKDEQGAPYVQLDALGKRLLQKYRATEIQLSLSHHRTMALAVALLA